MSDETDTRLAALEQRQDSTDSKLDELLDLIRGKGRAEPAHDAAQEHTETRLERSSSVAEQVRAELDRRQKDADDEQHKQTVSRELAELRAKLTERPPQPPQPRRQRTMWGERD